MSFTYGGRYYIITNALGRNGRGGPGWLQVEADLWASDSQTEGWALAVPGFIPRGGAGAWDSGFTYVTALAGGYNLSGHTPLFGAYMGGKGKLPAGGPISIGTFALSVA